MKRLIWLAGGAVVFLAFVIFCKDFNRAAGTAALNPNDLAAGASLYGSWGCATCHGESGRGTAKGPALVELSRNWEIQMLAAYLQNPQAVRARDKRLQMLSQRYFPLSMPAVELPAADRKKLAAYLLSLE